MSRKYVYLSLLLIFIVYLLKNFPLAYGISFHVIISITSISLVVIYLLNSRSMLSRIVSDKSIVMYLLLVGIIPRYMLGLIFGFGYNLSTLTLVDLLLTNVYTLSFVIGIECFRRVLIDNIIEHRSVKVWLPTLTTTILYISISNLTDPSIESVIYNMTVFLNQLFLTILAINTNISIQLLYSIPHTVMTKTLPILPAIPLTISLPLSIFITMSQLSIIYYVLIKNKNTTNVENLYISSLRRTLSTILNITAFTLTITLVLITISGYRLLIVTSGSMAPQINMGDIIVIDTNVNNITKEDVITFMVKDKIVTHRVIETFIKENRSYYLTKGDANKEVDPWVVRYDNILGKTIYSIPYIGMPIIFLAILSKDYVTFVVTLTSIILFIFSLYIVKEVIMRID